MALGKKCRSSLQLKHCALVADEGLELGHVIYARTFGRKRIVISNNSEDSPFDSSPKTPLKKQCGNRMGVDFEKSSFEALPQDILIRIICGVNHQDLKQLFHVSKSIREATLIAKHCHFAYSTPSKTRAFRSTIDFADWSEVDDIEVPDAPKQTKQPRSRLGGKKMGSISVALFASAANEEHCFKFGWLRLEERVLGGCKCTFWVLGFKVVHVWKTLLASFFNLSLKMGWLVCIFSVHVRETDRKITRILFGAIIAL